MEPSVPVFEKKFPVVSVPEWYRNIYRLQTEARDRRQQSYQLRHQAEQLRNETRITTDWDAYINTRLLNDRIFEVESLKEKQRFSAEKTRNEIEALREEKLATESHLEGLQTPLVVSAHCLATRASRPRTELTTDHLERELKQELNLIEQHKRRLADLCLEAWQQLASLTAVHHELQSRIEDKQDAITLDTHAKNLTIDSSNISYKLCPTRIPVDSMSEEVYIAAARSTIASADELIINSKLLRERMFQARANCANDLEARCHALEHELRKRIHSQEVATQEITWQKEQLEKTIQQVEQEITLLQNALDNKTRPGKLVETRLETRTKRPKPDLVHDRAQDGLIEEWGRIKMSESLLRGKLDDALNTAHATTGVSPAEVLVGRRLGGRLEMVRDGGGGAGSMQARVQRSHEQQVARYAGTPRSALAPQQHVLVRDYSKRRSSRWAPATVTEQLAPASYQVKLQSGEETRRHIDQILLDSTKDSVAVQDIDEGEDQYWDTLNNDQQQQLQRQLPGSSTSSTMSTSSTTSPSTSKDKPNSGNVSKHMPSPKPST